MKSTFFRTLAPFVVLCLSQVIQPLPVAAQSTEANEYPENVKRYLQRLYDEASSSLAYRDDYPGGFEKWQEEARSALCRRMGLARIAASVGAHQPTVDLSEPEDLDDLTRQKGVIETEPDVQIPFWLIKPKGDGPFPLGLFPHGHDPRGHNTTAGVYSNEAHQKKALAEDRDVALQAARLGFLAIAPAVRGLSIDGVPDINARHGNRPCRSQLMHCLAAGRTATGERVWDMQRLIDWAITRDDVDPHHILMMGNSGGGMVTIFAAACDKRITIAVPSCSFAPTTREDGYLFHCDCNMVPGILDFGGLPGVAGLIAPRHLLAVNGRKDTLFTEADIETGVSAVKAVYMAAGSPQNFDHQWGPEGHRFYANLMWPFVLEALKVKEE